MSAGAWEPDRSGAYRLCFSVAYRPAETPPKARILPFEALEIDLGYIFGESESVTLP